MPETLAEFAPGFLYVAGFAQARAPHLGLIIPTDIESGRLFHIHIDRTISQTWVYQCRTQKIKGDMFLTSLVKVSENTLPLDQLLEAASAVPAPDNDDFGECGPWVWHVLEKLHERNLIVLQDTNAVAEEVEAFTARNKAYARRDRFPNVAASQFSV